MIRIPMNWLLVGAYGWLHFLAAFYLLPRWGAAAAGPVGAWVVDISSFVA